MPLLSEIHLRDPYVLPVPDEAMYYLFGTTDEACWGPVGTGFNVYRSRDLRHWSGPRAAFRPPADFWADRHFWAPEVYRQGDGYLMFASFKAAGRCRGVQALRAENDPAGPFRPLGDGPLTPPDWECLDGTLHFESDGAPWMVFCREWKDVVDGTIEAMPLRPDLSAGAGPPVTLFAGSAVSWSRGTPDHPEIRVTDGPWLFRSRAGPLWMLWSTLGPGGYTLCLARSATGSVTGPWRQQAEPLFHRDGGHAMIFRRFDGAAMLCLHRPNRAPHERPVLFLVGEDDPESLELTPYERSPLTL